MTVQTETCANCGSTIGALETPYIWKNDVVCSTCHTKLTRANLTNPMATPTVQRSHAAGSETTSGGAALLGILLVVAVLVAIVWHVAGPSDKITPQEARHMSERLIKQLKVDSETSWNSRSGASQIDGSTPHSEFLYTVISCDVQSSPSVEFPTVVMLIISENHDMEYKGGSYESMSMVSSRISARVGRKDGRWQCIEAEERVESVLGTSAWQPGHVSDDTAAISNALHDMK